MTEESSSSAAENFLKKFLRHYDIDRIREQRVLQSFTIGRKLSKDFAIVTFIIQTVDFRITHFEQCLLNLYNHKLEIVKLCDARQFFINQFFMHLFL